jgi:capsular exopolysaccharide synthesis family protein
MKKHEAEKATEAAAAPPAAPAASAPAGAAPAAAQHDAAAEGDAAAPIGPVSLNGYAPELVAHHDRGNDLTEEYRRIRTHLLAQYAEERFCALVTSAMPTEGKTVTCLNLAFVLSEQQDRRTVIIDADLRKRRFGNMLHINNSPGLVELLRGSARLDEVVQATKHNNLFVIPAGPTVPGQVGEMLGRPELDEIVNELRRRYDYVLFDTPPLTVAPDASILGRVVRDAILVVRMNRTPRESVDRAIGLLHASNVKPIGIVLTHHRHFIPKALYYHS